MEGSLTDMLTGMLRERQHNNWRVNCAVGMCAQPDQGARASRQNAETAYN